LAQTKGSFKHTEFAGTEEITMPQIVNTNIASINAQRNLNKSQSELQTSLQRLSSGLRINSSKDDAAGLAIAERFTTQIRGLTVAVRNANDAISLTQTAEGALGEFSNLMQRIRELSLQSANASNSSSDRSALNLEAQQLLQELDRVASTTSFNGQKILNGGFSAQQFQIGANANETIAVSIGNASLTSLGSFQANGAVAVSSAAFVAGDVTINGIDVGVSANGSAEAKTASINNVTDQTGVTATASTSLTSANSILRNQALSSGDMLINGVNIGSVGGSNTIATQGSNLAAAINAVTSQTGVSATSDLNTGALTLSSATGKDIAITSTNGNAGLNRVENATGLEVRDATATASTNTVDFAGGAVGAAGTETVTFSTAAGAGSSNGDTFAVNGVTFAFDAAVAAGTALADGNISLGAATTGGTDADNATANALALATQLDANTTTTASAGAASATNVVTITSDVQTTTRTHIDAVATVANAGAGVAADGVAGIGAAAGDTLNVGGVTYEFTLVGGSVATAGNIGVVLGSTEILAGTNFFNAVNAQYTAGNTNIQATDGGAGVITLASDLLGSGTGNLTLTEVTTGTVAAVAQGTLTAGTDGAGTALTGQGVIELNSASIFSLGGNNLAKAGFAAASPLLSGLSAVDISNVAGSNSAIAVIDGALSQISTIRAGLGAIQNRLDSTISSQSSTIENLSAARSRILDADFAVETANLTRSQILQQAGISILSQANSLPQQVLALLQ
jgi:flagellin